MYCLCFSPAVPKKYVKFAVSWSSLAENSECELRKNHDSTGNMKICTGQAEIVPGASGQVSIAQIFPAWISTKQRSRFQILKPDRSATTGMAEQINGCARNGATGKLWSSKCQTIASSGSEPRKVFI